MFWPINCQIHDVAVLSWLLLCWLLESSALWSGEKMDNFHDKRTGIGPAELSSLDIVGRIIMELFSEHLIGATLGAQNENNSEGQPAWIYVIVWIVLPRDFFLYHTINNATQNKQFLVPWNIPTLSGLLGLTITEMGINFALKMLFRFSERVFVFHSLNQCLSQCPL